MTKKTASHITPSKTIKSSKRDEETTLSNEGKFSNLNIGGKKTYLNISSSNRPLVHHAAADAYLAWESIPKRTMHSALHTCLAENLSFATTIYLTHENESAQVDNKRYYFFDQFESIQRIFLLKNTALTPSPIPITLVSQLNIKVIQYRAWLELAKLLKTNIVDPEMGLPSLLLAINEKMPSEIRKLIFGQEVISVADIRDLYDVSRDQYDNQQKQWRKNLQLNKKTDYIFTFAELKRINKCRK